ncbi:MAG: hypothetical protein R3E13_07135 [Alphaproteobacteria bacterium]
MAEEPSRIIDRNISKPAEQFLKRLADDVILQGDVGSMSELIQGLFKKDSNGNLDFTEEGRKAAAARLIDGLDELDRNRDERSEEQQAQWEKATNVIESFFTDEELKTPEDIAGAIKAYEMEKHAAYDRAVREGRDARRFDILGMLEQGGSKMRMQLSQEVLDKLVMALNRISPGLGGVIGGILNLATGGQNHLTEDQRVVSSRFEQAFDAMTLGPSKLAAFRSVEHWLDADGDKVFFNRMLTRPSNTEGWKAFFSEEGMKDAHDGQPARYEFYDNDGTEGSDGKAGLPVSFDEMILKQLEDDGLIRFASDAARNDFIRYTHQIMVGTEALGETFVKALEAEGLITFDSDQARADFIDGLAELNPKYMDKDKLAMGVQYYALNVVKGVTLNGSLGEIAAVAHDFTRVTGRRDFAQRWMKYAQMPESGVELNMKQANDTRFTSSPSSPAAGALAGGGASAPRDVVRMAPRVDPSAGNGIQYGQSVTVSGSNFDDFGFSDSVTVYTLDDQGHMDVQPGASGNLSIDSDKIAGILNQGGNFELQRVVVNGDEQGFYAYNPQAGAGIYLGPDAIDRSAMSGVMKQELFTEIGDNPAPTTAAPSGPGGGVSPSIGQ